MLNPNVKAGKLQGYLARNKPPPPLGPPQGPRHSPTVGSEGDAVAYERGTPVQASYPDRNLGRRRMQSYDHSFHSGALAAMNMVRHDSLFSNPAGDISNIEHLRFSNGVQTPPFKRQLLRDIPRPFAFHSHDHPHRPSGCCKAVTSRAACFRRVQFPRLSLELVVWWLCVKGYLAQKKQRPPRTLP